MLTSKFANRELPSVALVDSTLRKNHRFVSGSVERCLKLFGESWAIEFEEVIGTLFPDSDALVAACNGYAKFAMQSMRLQAQFERELKYRSKSYEQAASEVYFNEQHMMQEYLPGLLLSHFLWPHHYRQLRFFENTFVQAMRVAEATSFVEVGIGTGLYSSLLLRKLPQVEGVGVDISPSAKHFSEAHVRAFNMAERYHVELCDVAVRPMEARASWLVCVEVLEHLDDPVTFLQGLRRNMNRGSRAFITAALNAAHTDHIYLYRNPNEVLAHLLEVGFTLEQSFVGSAYKPTLPGAPVPEAAAFIVY